MLSDNWHPLPVNKIWGQFPLIGVVKTFPRLSAMEKCKAYAEEMNVPSFFLKYKGNFFNHINMRSQQILFHWFGTLLKRSNLQLLMMETTLMTPVRRDVFTPRRNVIKPSQQCLGRMRK